LTKVATGVINKNIDRIWELFKQENIFIIINGLEIQNHIEGELDEVGSIYEQWFVTEEGDFSPLKKKMKYMKMTITGKWEQEDAKMIEMTSNYEGRFNTIKTYRLGKIDEETTRATFACRTEGTTLYTKVLNLLRPSMNELKMQFTGIKPIEKFVKEMR